MSFKVKLGRPFADGADTKKLHVLMPQDLIDKLDRIMKKLMVEGFVGVTRSDAIRYAIEEIHT
jgi:metal-responsive CopG/Arc/MetJ family transcriptional regulator